MSSPNKEVFQLEVKLTLMLDMHKNNFSVYESLRNFWWVLFKFNGDWNLPLQYCDQAGSEMYWNLLVHHSSGNFKTIRTSLFLCILFYAKTSWLAKYLWTFRILEIMMWCVSSLKLFNILSPEKLQTYKFSVVCSFSGDT